jgi:hypothetical protein
MRRRYRVLAQTINTKNTSYLYVVGQGRFCAGPLEPDPTATGKDLFPAATVSATLG